MIFPFIFAPLPRIVFGTGKSDQLANFVTVYGKTVLLLCGRNSLIKSGRFESIISGLNQERCRVYIENIESEPSPGVIDRITGQYYHHNIQVVLAIGGGSVLDAGKAVSAMLPLNEQVKLYLEGVGNKIPDGRKIPFIAMPTTAGTGSETTKNAVISQVGPDGFKKSLRHDHYVPDIAIVDPQLCLNCPPEITGASGMDAFSQLLEAYLSPACDEMTSSLVLSGIQAVKRSLLKAVEDGNDINARTDMSYAAMISGIGLANAGLGIVHGFASPLGGFFNIPHGVVCGTLMAACNKYTLQKARNEGHKATIEKYNNITGLFFEKGTSDKKSPDHFVEILYELSEKLKIPGLGSYGIRESDMKKIIDETGNKNNPVQMNEEEMLLILKECI